MTYRIITDPEKLYIDLDRKTFQFKKNSFKKFLLVHFKINRLKKAPLIPVRYAKTAGIKLDNEGLEIFTDNIADSRLELNEKYIGLCPGAKHFTKRWPKEYFIDLGKILETSGYKVALFGSADESETIKEIESQLGNPLNLCNDSILQTAANMKMCKAIYTNDSGSMHLSCAVDVPVIAFFGSTVKEFGFYPYKNQNVVLEIEDLPCRPCTHIGRNSCPLKHFKCMKEIKPELAFNSLKQAAFIMMKKFWQIFYNIIFIPLLYVILVLISLFNKKVRIGISGRKRIFEEFNIKSINT